MMGLEQIVAENAKATRKAKGKGLQPYIATVDGDERVRHCPNLGNYVPKGGKVSNTYFVDNSGMGSEGEPALTFKQFLRKVEQFRGYAISEVGQFQVHINEYKRV